MTKKRLFIIFFCVLFACTSPGHAKNAGKQSSVSPWLYKQLKKTEQLIGKKSYDQALKKFHTMLGKVDKGSYEEATVLRSMSSVYALQEKYNKAIKFLSRALTLKMLPEVQQQQALLNLGQLYMATEQYAMAVKTLRPWLANNPNHDAQIYILLANAYAQLKQYREALPYIETAIKTAKKPVESWYQLNLALYYELEDYRSSAKVLKILVDHYPDKKTYWDQYAAIYQQLKVFKKAATIKKLAYKKGLLSTEKELLDLVNLHLYIDLPFQAARLLDKQINIGKINNTVKNQELLANAWTQAKEFDRAIKALDRASQLSAKGALYQQLGRIYVEQEKWSLAVTALSKALEKGSLKNKGDTYILLGMSYHELDQPKQARQSFQKARKLAKTRKAASQWLNYISEATAE